MANAHADPANKTINYAEKYDLKSDPILSAPELLQYGQPLVNVRTGQPPTIEEWQQMVRDILLIPQVPESVCHTFAAAKKLFIFGYYEYSFSTASQHYALLALEAALQVRWSATLPRPCPVRYSNGVTTNFDNITHKLLYDHCRVDPKIIVNGDRFPRTNRKLAASLAKSRIITPQEEQRIIAGLDVRNDLSHLEFAPIMGASAEMLSVVSELINAMFDSVPLSV
ncbi:MAG: hypothetical protein ABSG52_00895 [Terriglobales bacterium]|jgi:hypothetical protein